MRLYKQALTGGSLILLCTSLYATTFLGPSANLRYTDHLTADSAYSVAAEAGVKNMRVGGTLAYKVAPNQRVKLSAEYLADRLTYEFASGNTEQWVQQGALGVGYQYDLSTSMFQPQLDLNATYSHAPSKNLGSRNFATNFTNERRIAGSNAASFNPGVTLKLLPGTTAGVDVNYDNVRYDTKFSGNKDAVGLGGTMHVTQQLTQAVNLDLVAAVRAPYNNYQAHLAWAAVPHMPNWTVGVDGAYTVGKNNLPSSYDVGLSASYNFAARHESASPDITINAGAHDEFSTWAATPAVHMPQVLAIADERVSGSCTPPVYLGGAPSSISAPVTPGEYIEFSPFFTGAGIIYSYVVVAGTLTGGEISIDPTTGTLFVVMHDGQPAVIIHVVATSCGVSVTTGDVEVIFGSP